MMASRTPPAAALSLLAAALLLLAALPSQAGEKDAAGFLEKARAARSRGDERAIRRLVAGDRFATREAVELLLNGESTPDEGLSHLLAGAYASAFGDRSLLDRTAAFGRWTPAQRQAREEARKARSRALEAFQAGRHADAEAGFLAALETFRAIDDPREAGRVLSNLGALAALRGDTEAALGLLDEARRAAERAGDLTQLGAIDINRGYALDDRGEDEAARAAYESAIRLGRETGDAQASARALLSRGALDHEAGRLEEAEAAFRQAAVEGRALDDGELISTALFNLARLREVVGDLEGAGRFYARARDAAAAQGWTIQETETILAICDLDLRRGDLPSAHRCLEAARRVGASTDAPATLARIDYLEGRIAAQEGRYDAALEAARRTEDRLEGTDLAGLRSAARGLRSVALFYTGAYDDAVAETRRGLEEARSADRPDLEAAHRARLGHLLMVLGEPAASLAELGQAARLYREIGSPLDAATVLDALGVLRMRTGDAEGARRTLREAYETIPASADPVARAETAKDLAILEMTAGQPARAGALALLREAETIFARLDDPLGLVHVRILLARALLDAGDLDGARRELEAARRGRKGRGGTEHDWLLDETEGRISERSGDDHAAARAYARSVDHVERVRAGSSREARRAALLEDRIDPYRGLTRVLLRRGDAAAAWESARAGKARSFVERLAPPVLDASLPPSTPGRSPRPSPALPSAKILSRLEAGEVLLDYFPDGREAIVFVGERKGLSVVRIPFDERALSGPIAAATNPGRPGDGSATADAWRSACRRLGAALLAPLEARLAGARRVLIVPGGALHGLPFAALELDGAPLVARVTPIVLPAAESLASRARTPSAATEGILVVGDPAVPPPSRRLPGAEAEARAVAATAGIPSVLLIGAEASEGRVRRAAGSASMLHIAAHGRLDPVSPPRSFLALAPGGGDGRWEASEIAGSDIPADVVVLSGCGTGTDLGLVRTLPSADERAGLARAFLAAGAGTAIGSLWEIDDRSSAAIVPALYPALRDEPAADALAALQRNLIAGRLRDAEGGPLDHPFHWAGWVAWGAGGGPAAAVATAESRSREPGVDRPVIGPVRRGGRP